MFESRRRHHFLLKNQHLMSSMAAWSLYGFDHTTGPVAQWHEENRCRIKGLVIGQRRSQARVARCLALVRCRTGRAGICKPVPGGAGPEDGLLGQGIRRGVGRSGRWGVGAAGRYISDANPSCLARVSSFSPAQCRAYSCNFSETYSIMTL